MFFVVNRARFQTTFFFCLFPLSMEYCFSWEESCMTSRSLSQPAFIKLTHGSKQAALSEASGCVSATLVGFLPSACWCFAEGHTLFTQGLLLPISILNGLSQFGISQRKLGCGG
ncbi:hypothetical protein BDV37DRAFT_236868 [Aspergillus pseudonomiae]|uniref:Secreted protein n=1 Tax=Aspergillus pseudonomiae TaxID=1506151 RepID=A0A5N7DS63_9EURO|nr:uncharacterized protein BDV37DRAFT_236868 [Aspergillus pseudonomiae]KAE8409125.1 hypothetical protein BDV37DRAFT_236868 [Aspergillus pseudonomiae]